MTDKLQQLYNSLIKYSNKNYLESQMDIYSMMQNSLQAKAEAFESAADLLWSKFKEEINPCTTMRFEDIRKHHMTEDVEEKNKNIEA
jgi:hypothetical protein